jgi:hypothetical protein
MVGAPMIEGVIAPVEALLQAAVMAVSFSLGENTVPIILGGLGGRSLRYFRGKGFRIATKVSGVILFILGIAFIFYDTIAPSIVRMLG